MNKKINQLPILGLIVFFAISLQVFAQAPSIQKLNDTLNQLQKKQTIRPTDPALARDWDLLQFKIKKIRFLLKMYKPTPPLLEMVSEELQKVNKLLTSLHAKTPCTPEPGLTEEAYFDNTDGSVQPFITYLPTNYDKAKKYPLIIYLHGYSPYLNIVNWSQVPDELTELAEKTDAVLAMPFARSNTDFQGIGELDVLNVIDQVKKRYNIDQDRIFLTGMSMGGMGVYTIGAHYPHLFAGLVILSGRGDFYFWHNMKSSAIPKYQQNLIDKEFAISHLPNLDKIPIWIYHGDADTLIPIKEARHMKSVLNKKSNIKYKEIPGGDHWIYDKAFKDPELIKWLKTASRKFPEEFSFNSYHPSYNQAYWLYIAEYADTLSPAAIKVKVKDDKINIDAYRVEELIVDRNLMPEKIRKLPIVKGSDFKLKEFPDYKNPQPHYPWGPVKDAFLEPFMFVNAGIPSSNIQKRVLEWYKFAKSLPRLKKEKNLNAQDKKDFNLFLFGEPETSPMIKEILKTTPVQVTETEYIIADKKFPRKGNGLFLKYVSPWNPAKSVVIQCGIPWGKNCSENHLYDSIPGYIIYSDESNPCDPFGGNKPLDAGFFDRKGKISH